MADDNLLINPVQILQKCWIGKVGLRLNTEYNIYYTTYKLYNICLFLFFDFDLLYNSRAYIERTSQIHKSSSIQHAICNFYIAISFIHRKHQQKLRIKFELVQLCQL